MFKKSLVLLLGLSTATTFLSCQSNLPDNEKQLLLRERDSLKNALKSNEIKYLEEKDSLITELNDKKEELRIVQEEKSKINLNLSLKYWRSEHSRAKGNKILERRALPLKGDINIYGDEFTITTNDVISDVVFKGKLVKKLSKNDGQYFKYEILITQHNDDLINRKATLEHTRHTNGKTFIIINYDDIFHIYGVN